MCEGGVSAYYLTKDSCGYSLLVADICAVVTPCGGKFTVADVNIATEADDEAPPSVDCCDTCIATSESCCAECVVCCAPSVGGGNTGCLSVCVSE